MHLHPQIQIPNAFPDVNYKSSIITLHITSSNNLSNENVKTGVSRDMIFQEFFILTRQKNIHSPNLNFYLRIVKEFWSNIVNAWKFLSGLNFH